MLTTQLSRLLATGAVCAALAGGAVAITPTPAQAAGSAAAAYSCDFGARGVQTVPVAYSMPTLPSTALAGIALPQLPVSAQLTLPAGLGAQLVGAGNPVKGAVDNLTMAVGFGAVPVSLAGSTTPTSGAAPTVVEVSGLLGSINPGLAGPIPVAFPKSFNLTLQRANGAGVGTFPCSQGTAPTAGTIQVSQQKATLTATTKKKVKATKSAVIKVSVTRQVGTPTGMVYATLNGKTVGHAKLKRTGAVSEMELAKLKPGSYKIKLRYEGDPITSKASKNVKITVVR